ncbi:MAG: hypothetical protein K8R69_07825 [Deltaproteobacteria bacterium]|nr:hypothetical protein [Deltaproteobacteria bacterium]
MSLPLIVDFSKQKVLVAGVGPLAVRCLFALVKAGAEVRLIGTGSLPKEIELMVANREIRHWDREVRRSDLAQVQWVFVAEKVGTRRRQLLAWARGQKVWATSLVSEREGTAFLPPGLEVSGVSVAFWGRGTVSDWPIYLRRRLQRALPRWLRQAKGAGPRLKRRLIRGWHSVARFTD